MYLSSKTYKENVKASDCSKKGSPKRLVSHVTTTTTPFSSTWYQKQLEASRPSTETYAWVKPGAPLERVESRAPPTESCCPASGTPPKSETLPKT